jgi:hypothetical protein
MRSGPGLLLTCVLAYVALCSPAWAADTLKVIVDNNSIALGEPTTLAAHIETDAGYGGGHLAMKFKPADTDCAPTPDADTGGMPIPVDSGAGTADVGGQQIQLDVGNWVVCGWLIDDATGATVAAGSTGVQVVPYLGSISISVKRQAKAFQFVLAWSTSAAARFFAVLQPAKKDCAMTPDRMPRKAIPIVPRAGRLVGSDGGLGKSLNAKRLKPGRWRVCSWLRAEDTGSFGPVTKAFSVPRSRRRGGRAAG